MPTSVGELYDRDNIPRIPRVTSPAPLAQRNSCFSDGDSTPSAINSSAKSPQALHSRKDAARFDSSKLTSEIGLEGSEHEAFVKVHE